MEVFVTTIWKDGVLTLTSNSSSASVDLPQTSSLKSRSGKAAFAQCFALLKEKIDSHTEQAAKSGKIERLVE